jgi:hypothetical protein
MRWDLQSKNSNKALERTITDILFADRQPQGRDEGISNYRTSRKGGS